MRRSAVLVVAGFVLFVGVPSAFGQNGSDFEDVPAGHPAEGAIGWAAENGVTVGVGNNRFGVGQTLTRYQMVTFLCRAYDPSSCGSGTKGSDRFDDVPAGHWADYSVGWAVNRSITSGISATAFGGAQTLTREQMMTFLYRAEGSPAGGSNGSDVFQDGPEPGHWASLAIGWAFDEGVTGGIAAGTFGLGTNVSREEMVLFLCRTVAPGTCQPSQQPLPSSVVTTSTTTDDPDPPQDTTPDSDESTAIERTAEDHNSEEVIPDPGLYSWAFTEGSGSLRGVHPVHVFYCARQRKYTAQDLTEVVRLLNEEASPRWTKESSGLFTFVFTEGSVISPDLPWDTVDLETAYPQCRARDVLDPSRDPRKWREWEQLLLLVDTPRSSRDAAGYGGGRFATSMTLEHLGMNGFLGVVNHELGHALPGLRHDYTACFLETLMTSYESLVPFDCGDNLFLHSRENLILGEWDPSSPQPFYGQGLLLSCYDRRLLGWPVGGESPPCSELVAAPPQQVTIDLHGDGYIFSWTPPAFTGGFPNTGYTAVVISVEELYSVRDGPVLVYERRELSTEERSFVLDAPPGEYVVAIWANTKHGPGTLYKTIAMRILPSPEEVRVSELTPTSFKLDWTPVASADYYLVSLVEASTYEIDMFGGINVTPSVRADGTSYGATSLDGTSQLFTFLPGLVDPPQPGTEYNIKVSACRFEGDLDFFTGLNCSHGKVLTVTTPPAPPATQSAPPATQLPIVRGVGVEVDPSGDIWLTWDPVVGGDYFEVDNPFYDPEAPDVSTPGWPHDASPEEWTAWEKQVTGNPEMLEEWHAWVRIQPFFVIPYREPDYPGYRFSADKYPFHPIEPDTTYETGIRACRGEAPEDGSVVRGDCSETKRVTFTSPPSAS